METSTIYSLHAEHKEWLEKLKFYKDEVEIMEKRIAEVASKYTHKDVLAQIEHFQNQCIIQRERIDILRHNVNEAERELEKNINNNPTAVDHRKVKDEVENRDQVNTLEKIFTDLRRELNEFLSKTM